MSTPSLLAAGTPAPASGPLWTRRNFISSALAMAGAPLWAQPTRVERPAYPVIDIHQHTSFRARGDDDLMDHQARLGVSKTILLPAGRMNGLAAGASGNLHTFRLAETYPKLFATFANDVVHLPGALKEIEFFLKKGAIGIGELKDNTDCDSVHMRRVADLAREYRVPMLMHFEEGVYNSGFTRFHRMVENYPTVTFIAHAPTWWANIDGNYQPGSGKPPRTKPVPGGLSDRWLATYPNLYADLSASGAQALLRDADFTRDFIQRHQDKLLFGTDCYCRAGTFPTGGCRGDALMLAFSQSIAVPAFRKKILFENAQRIFRFPEFA
ncbi:MAG: amidohydrolase [Opitutus sp.]|nr:amidohydrolase [Opitutus sp.]